MSATSDENETMPREKVRLTVLVVDDEYREHLVERYEARGCVVEEAADGQEAIDKLCGGLVPNVVLTDLRMPRVDGNALVEWIATQPHLDHARVAVITGIPSEVSARAHQRAAVLFKGTVENVDRVVFGNSEGQVGHHAPEERPEMVPCNHTTATRSWTSEECPLCGDGGMRSPDAAVRYESSSSNVDAEIGALARDIETLR